MEYCWRREGGREREKERERKRERERRRYVGRKGEGERQITIELKHLSTQSCK